MRKLVLVRGAPASGKSRFLSETLGFEGAIVSSDAIRTLVAGVVMGPHGAMTVSQEQNARVARMMREIVGERMARGDTLAVDMVHEGVSDLNPWLELAAENGYESLVVEFGGMPLAEALRRNAARREHARVPESTVARMHASILAHPAADHAFKAGEPTVVEWAADGSHMARVTGWLDVPHYDMSAYERVVHVGDIQGCHTVLAGPGGPLEGGPRDDTLYVLVGDLLDRGIENGKVMRFVLDELVGRPNVAFVRGNHERHLELWSRGLPAVSDDFSRQTLPQILAAGVTPADAGELCARLRDVFTYHWRGQDVLVTHGGLAGVPARPWMISTSQYVSGTGHYDEPVDRRFSEGAPGNWTQVHGHRNPHGLPALAAPRSFSLEDRVEFGGNLRLAILDASGWRVEEHRNRVFTKEAPRARDERTTPDWMLRGDRAPTTLPDATVGALRAHKGVRERQASAASPHVSSFGFTKNVFYERAWDDVAVKARGLFVNRHTNGVVARSYDKFFNAGEVADTAPEALGGSLEFPLRAFDKANGFLGILGYDDAAEDLFVASKSLAEGRFADMFRSILASAVPDHTRTRMARWLRDNEACMAFEVIDPVGDPHIVRYDKPGLVLLDVFHRSATGERLSFDKLRNVAKVFGLTPKEQVARLRDAAALEGFLARTSRLDYRINGRETEGFVIEDAAGFMFKQKAGSYTFWKRMRGQVDYMLRARSRDEPWSPNRVGDTADPALALEFLDWASSQTDEALGRGIIVLRERFLAGEPSEAPRLHGETTASFDP